MESDDEDALIAWSEQRRREEQEDVYCTRKRRLPTLEEVRAKRKRREEEEKERTSLPPPVPIHVPTEEEQRATYQRNMRAALQTGRECVAQRVKADTERVAAFARTTTQEWPPLPFDAEYVESPVRGDYNRMVNILSDGEGDPMWLVNLDAPGSKNKLATLVIDDYQLKEQLFKKMTRTGYLIAHEETPNGQLYPAFVSYKDNGKVTLVATLMDQRWRARHGYMVFRDCNPFNVTNSNLEIVFPPWYELTPRQASRYGHKALTRDGIVESENGFHKKDRRVYGAFVARCRWKNTCDKNYRKKFEYNKPHHSAKYEDRWDCTFRSRAMERAFQWRDREEDKWMDDVRYGKWMKSEFDRVSVLNPDATQEDLCAYFRNNHRTDNGLGPITEWIQGLLA